MSPRAWNTRPALKSSMGSPTSEGWANLDKRDRMRMGSRKPLERATRRTKYFQGNQLGIRNLHEW